LAFRELSIDKNRQHREKRSDRILEVWMVDRMNRLPRGKLPCYNHQTLNTACNSWLGNQRPQTVPRAATSVIPKIRSVGRSESDPAHTYDRLKRKQGTGPG